MKALTDLRYLDCELALSSLLFHKIINYINENR
jgi:hypothetical protein